MFLDKILELSPKREIKFVIDLIARANLYPPIKLTELKKQLKDLFEKQFI